MPLPVPPESLALLAGGSIAATWFLNSTRTVSLRLKLRARLGARRVKNGDFSEKVIEDEERVLLLAYYSQHHSADLPLISRGLEYLRIVDDLPKSTRSRQRPWLFAAMIFDSFVLSQMVADTVVVNGSLLERAGFAAAVGLAGGALIGSITHAAGQSLRRYIASTRIRRWAIAHGVVLGNEITSLNQKQNEDASLAPFIRAWNRMTHTESLWPVKAAIALDLAVGLAAFLLRWSQLEQLGAEGLAGLPSGTASVVGLCTLLLLFLTLQGYMGWHGFRTALVGRESHFARRMADGFVTALEARRYRSMLVSGAARLQSYLHEHIKKWNAHCGCGPVRKILDPQEVLK
jgi:hypothetical protein